MLASEAGDVAYDSSSRLLGSVLSCALGFRYGTQRSGFGGFEGIVSGTTTLLNGGLLVFGKDDTLVSSSILGR